MTIMINGRRRDSRKRTDFSLSNLLTSTIGRGHRSSENDILNMRQRFRALGLDSGYAQDAYLDRKLDGAIRRFQRAHDLKEDGVMRPGGETDILLMDELFGRSDNGFEGRQVFAAAPIPTKKPPVTKAPQSEKKPDYEDLQADQDAWERIKNRGKNYMNIFGLLRGGLAGRINQGKLSEKLRREGNETEEMEVY